jgi:hypothetical protein
MKAGARATLMQISYSMATDGLGDSFYLLAAPDKGVR